ncbi:MAG TPA: MFS transporter [Candidatus Lokiarchaeia archaeon]|nr:MFS transporter [Candidatus Lokiarchaeia archaeon]
MPEKLGTDQSIYSVSPYRWIVLLFFVVASTMTQIIWITYAPITIQAANILTDGNVFGILFLSMVYMIFYLPMNFPANWCLEKYGLKRGAGIGVILMGFFGFFRGLTTNYVMILTCQIITAIGQPFVLNSYTKLAVNWFPEKEKTLATGLCTMSLMLGVLCGMLISGPFFVAFGFYALGMFYGLLSLVSMVLFFVFIKDKPTTPPNSYAEKYSTKIVHPIQTLFKNRDFMYYSIIILISYGAINAILSEVDLIVAPPRVLDVSNTDIAGIIGSMIVVGGIVGSVVLSWLSDRLHKRKIFLIITMLGGFPLTILIGIISSFTWLCVDTFCFGFTLFGSLPIGLTYVAEITFPIPEEISNGMIMWVAQIGGIIFLFYFNLTVISLLLIITWALVFLMRDSNFYKQ